MGKIKIQISQCVLSSVQNLTGMVMLLFLFTVRKEGGKGINIVSMCYCSICGLQFTDGVDSFELKQKL